MDATILRAPQFGYRCVASSASASDRRQDQQLCSALPLALAYPLVSHVLGMARQLTEGDFEALVLWCEVAHRSFVYQPSSGIEGAAISDRSTKLAAVRNLAGPLTLRDLTEATGIPRETVRRKLARPAACGHLKRHSGGWVISADHLERTIS